MTLPASIARIKPMPLRFTVPLTNLPNGKYDCQVTVLDPDGTPQRASFWEAPIEVVN